MATASMSIVGMAFSLARMDASRFLSVNIVLLWILVLAATTAVIAAPSLLTAVIMIPDLGAILSLGTTVSLVTVLRRRATLILRTILVAVEDTTTDSELHPAARVSAEHNCSIPYLGYLLQV